MKKKRCEYCAERIFVDARICRFCDKDVFPNEVVVVADLLSAQKDKAPNNDKSFDKKATWLAVVACIFALTLISLGNIQSLFGGKNLDLYLKFEDQRAPLGPILYGDKAYTCSDAKANQSRAQLPSEQSGLVAPARRLILNKKTDVRIYANSNDLIAFSNEALVIEDGSSTTCYIRYQFEDLALDDYPFVINLGENNDINFTFNKRDIINDELFIDMTNSAL